MIDKWNLAQVVLISLLSLAAANQPDPCDGRHVDAAVEIGDEVYLFKGEYFWTFKDGQLSGRPRHVSKLWPDLPGNVDSAFSYDRNTYFFVGNKVYVYDKHRHLKKTVSLTAYGIPEHVKKIRLAFVWYHGPETPIFYMWSDTVTYKYDVNTGRTSTNSITYDWDDATANLDMNGENYIFTPRGLHKFNKQTHLYNAPIQLTDLFDCDDGSGDDQDDGPVVGRFKRNRHGEWLLFNDI